LKIGIFTDSYLPYTSGVVRSIVTFKEELISNGHEVYIFAPSYDNCVEEEGVFRFSSIKSPTNRDFTLAWPFSFEFGPMVKKLDLDLIHVHSPFLLGRLGASYARKLDIPLVFTYHTLYEQYVHYLPFAGTLAKDITQHISRSFSNRCDLVIVPTAAIETYLRKIGVTPWADAETAAERMGPRYVMAFKPNPAFVTAPGGLDAARAEIKRGIAACRKNSTSCDVVLKDISTTGGDWRRLAEWEQMAMREVMG